MSDMARIAQALSGILGDDDDYSGTSPKKGRGMSARSIALIQAMHTIAEQTQPITGRGVGYKLFTQKLIPSMSRRDMRVVYRLLLLARERGIIPWNWIVDETRGIERVATWDDPEDYARSVAESYRREFWNQQPHRIQVWSEKGTVRGVLAPVLNKYQVGFNPVHGFNSATNTYEAAQDDDGRDLIVLYVGDYDPSGMYMSEADLPKRLAQYGGDHIELRRIALTADQVGSLPSFPASDKTKDTRYRWFVNRYGDQCWELDAMDPRVLRNLVEDAIQALIDPVAWARCEAVNKEEQKSMRFAMERWINPGWQDPAI
jgi:hypothetical protein